MTKFKKGDKVKIIDNHTFRERYADQSYIGKIGIVSLDDSSNLPYRIESVDGDFINWFTESDLELVPDPMAEPKTLDNLEVGDVITNGPLDRVIIKIETLYTIQPIDKIDTFSHTLEQLKEYGYKLIDPTKPTVKINDKEYILNEKLAKAIEEAEEL